MATPSLASSCHTRGVLRAPGRDEGALRCPRHSRSPHLQHRPLFLMNNTLVVLWPPRVLASRGCLIAMLLAECRYRLPSDARGSESVRAGSKISTIRQTWVQSHFINSSKVTWDESSPLWAFLSGNETKILVVGGGILDEIRGIKYLVWYLTHSECSID